LKPALLDYEKLAASLWQEKLRELPDTTVDPESKVQWLNVTSLRNYKPQTVADILRLRVAGGFHFENSRLRAQQGVLVCAPLLHNIDEFLTSTFDKFPPVLTKYILDTKNRELDLLFLQRMNLHEASLFPGLEGAARYAARSLRSFETGSGGMAMGPSFGLAN
jgi:hypothetical protein